MGASPGPARSCSVPPSVLWVSSPPSVTLSHLGASCTGPWLPGTPSSLRCTPHLTQAALEPALPTPRLLNCCGWHCTPSFPRLLEGRQEGVGMVEKPGQGERVGGSGQGPVGVCLWACPLLQHPAHLNPPFPPPPSLQCDNPQPLQRHPGQLHQGQAEGERAGRAASVQCPQASSVPSPPCPSPLVTMGPAIAVDTSPRPRT